MHAENAQELDDSNPKEIVPNALALNSSIMTEENVEFMDEAQGIVHGGNAVALDTTRTEVNEADTTLASFLSRPVLISTKTVPVNGTFFDEFIDVWKLFFQNPAVYEKISRYKLMQCKMHVKAVINGTPFHYGRIMLSYNPLFGYDALQKRVASSEVFLIGISQKPRIILNPTECSGGEMILPFFWHKNALDFRSEDVDNIGTLRLTRLTPLQHAAGATNPVTISIFAWAEDVKVSLPTHQVPSFIPNAASEYATGPVSRPASVAASIARKLSKIPIIGPYAKATDIGASAISKMASLFGYSRPAILESSVMKPVVKSSLACATVNDDTQKLSLDAKQELSVDPRIFGVGGEDEMDIAHIAQKESFLTTFPMSLSNVQEEILWNCVVDPGIHNTTGTGTTRLIHMPACCYAVTPFNKWRGSMKYRFQVVCSKYHRGRIKVVYDPVATPTGVVPPAIPAPYNTAYTKIVDICETTDFTVDVGWGQATTFKEHAPLTTPPSDLFGAGVALNYDSEFDDYGNGTLSVYVVNELTAPDSTAGSDIYVNVFVSAGDDFEVAQPDGTYLANLRLKAPGEILRPEILPNAESVEGKADFCDNVDVQDQAPVTQMAAKTDPNDIMGLVHFGEKIKSFRQLIKRYSQHETIPIVKPSFGATGLQYLGFKITRWSLPFEPGYTDTQTGQMTTTTKVPFTLAGGQYAYGYMTPLRYLTASFAGWRGGVRYLVDFSQLQGNDYHTTVRASRYRKSSLKTEEKKFTGSTVNEVVSLAEEVVWFEDVTGQDGNVITSLEVNPTMSFEVPYYSEYRFCPAQILTDFGDFGVSGAIPTFKVATKARYNGDDYPYSTVSTYAAAAEDFQVAYFVGAPPMYLEENIPTA